MVTLRNFINEDAAALQQYQYKNVPLEEIQKMILEWEKKEFQGNYFEMFAIVREDTIVGTISLQQQSQNIVSCGLEVFSDYRRQGLGKEAMALILEIAKNKGYKIMCDQVRVNNTASIALHLALGFESTEYVYINQKGREVFVYLKAL